MEGGKTILLISPQHWDGLKLSKHHYAEELARLGNRVYFLNPFTRLGRPGRQEITESEIKNLWIVDQQSFLPLRIFDVAKPIVQGILRRQLKELKGKVGRRFDISWNFDNSSGAYMDQSMLPADYRVFQPVDRIPERAKFLKHADKVISVAGNILNDYAVDDDRKLLVPHALGRHFVEYAQRLIGSSTVPRHDFTRIQVGYLGNLEIPAVDRDLLQRIVVLYPEIHFHFIGPYNSTQSNVMNSWKNFCRYNKNTTLYGLLGPQAIISLAKRIDAWLVCYDRHKDRNSGSNSHKITEYLATGRPLISTRIDAVVGMERLVCVSIDDTQQGFFDAFSTTVRNIAELSDTSRTQERIRYALARSCREVLAMIANSITASR